MELIQQIKNLPFLRILIPLVSGILVQEIFPVPSTFSLILILFLIAGLFVCFFYPAKSIQLKQNFNFTFGVLAFFFFVYLGAYLYQQDKNTNRPEGISGGLYATYSGMITDYPVFQKNSTRLSISLARKIDSARVSRITGHITCYMKAGVAEEVKPGDLIVFRSALSKIENSGNPNDFDFQKYFERMGVYYYGFLDSADFKIVEPKRSFFLKREAYKLRSLLADILETYLASDNAPIAQAMVLGLRDSVTDEMKDGFASAGIMHILAISGLHVGILFLFLSKMWDWVTFSKKNRIGKALFVILGIWGYAFLTGFPPSVIRASLMLTLFLFADAFKRYYASVNSVLFAAVILLIFNPGLLFNISFQLSFTAVLGILTLYPLIVSIYKPRSEIINYIWKIMVVSFSAQIGTLPVSLYYFNLFPTLFLFANVIAIPAAFVIVIGSIIMFLASWYPGATQLIGKIVNFNVEIISQMSRFVDGLVFSRIDHIMITQMQSILLYLILILGLSYYLYRRVYMLKAGMLIILFYCLLYVQNIVCQSPNDIILNSEDQLVLVSEGRNEGVIMGDTLFEISKSDEIKYLLSPYMIDSVRIVPFNSPETQLIAIHSGFEPVYVGDNDDLNNIINKRLYIPIIIIMGKNSWDIHEINEKFTFDKILFHASVPYYIKEKQKQICRELKIPYHDLNKDGAFRL